MNLPRTATDQTRGPTRERSSRRGWLLFLLPVVLIGVVMAAGVTGDVRQTDGEGPAPEFTLPTTTGEEIALSDVLADGDALVYFSMGIGCDGCFAQIPEIEPALEHLGITLVSVMIDPADLLAREKVRFGIESPILIDADRRVSDAYGMLGQFGHGDRPSHSFALVRSDGTMARTVHYPTMFVPLDQLLDDLDLDLDLETTH
jgi:peroxiredoxin